MKKKWVDRLLHRKARHFGLCPAVFQAWDSELWETPWSLKSCFLCPAVFQQDTHNSLPPLRRPPPPLGHTGPSDRHRRQKIEVVYIESGRNLRKSLWEAGRGRSKGKGGNKSFPHFIILPPPILLHLYKRKEERGREKTLNNKLC
jgi:hypothetical protein